MEPIRALPPNPRYFEFRGRQTMLITSAEHYGAVLNLDFDFVPYLDELARLGLNQTRVFSGVYSEVPGSFGIRENTLAPRPGRHIAPWARSDEPGHPAGGNLFDLTRWNDDYFDRLRSFMEAASERGVVAEIAFFCQWYNDKLWAASPMSATGNVNGIGDVPRREAYDARHESLRRVQEEVVVKLVTELNRYDNLYYELGNEVHYAHFPEFLERIAEVVRRTEAGLPQQHRIAAYFGNRGRFVPARPKDVDVINFHYAVPDAVVANRHLNCPVVLNETGFEGFDPYPYRREAWRFMMSGGAGYSALDYSFTPDRPDGLETVTEGAPGCGGPQWRAQVSFMKQFLEGFDLSRVELRDEMLHGHRLGPRVDARILAQPPERYAVYLSGASGETSLGISAPAGRYAFRWLSPGTGQELSADEISHESGACHLAVPPFEEDLLLELRKI